MLLWIAIIVVCVCVSWTMPEYIFTSTYVAWKVIIYMRRTWPLHVNATHIYISKASQRGGEWSQSIPIRLIIESNVHATLNHSEEPAISELGAVHHCILPNSLGWKNLTAIRSNQHGQVKDAVWRLRQYSCSMGIITIRNCRHACDGRRPVNELTWMKSQGDACIVDTQRFHAIVGKPSHCDFLPFCRPFKSQLECDRFFGVL